MAHSSTYVRTVPERSRSRDEPMWQSRHSQQRGRQYDPRSAVPPAPRLRKVLVIVDIQSVRPLMNKAHDDVMDATTCDVLPSAGWKKEPCSPTMSYSMPTVLNHSRCTTFYTASASTSGTPGIATYPRPPWTSCRWQDDTGDTFALRNEDRLVELLHEYRPHWTEGQEFGILFPNNIRHFTSHFQPYIMRMSCHEALPNRNMLP